MEQRRPPGALGITVVIMVVVIIIVLALAGAYSK